MKKALRTFRGSMLICLMGALCACQQAAPARVNVKVFDVPEDVADRILPKQSRSYPAGSNYFRTLSSNTNELTQSGSLTDAGILLDETRETLAMPDVCHTWCYDKAYGTGFVSGSLGDAFGVQTLGGDRREIQIDGGVFFGSGLMIERGVYSRISYQGPVSPDAIVFARPFTQTNGKRLDHIVVFTVYAE